jgi:hypothetical protein
VLRRAENVTLSRSPIGHVTVQVGKMQYTLMPRPTKEQWTADRARYVSQLPSGVRWGACATALVMGSSAFLVGGFTGFLFGIPRTITAPGPNPSTGVTQFQGNTNLEQVSDWLTKIIVGVGLVQIGRIIPALSKFTESMKAPLGGQASSGAFGLGLAIANV